MGRAGIEPATLGLGVPLHEAQRTASAATSCNELKLCGCVRARGVRTICTHRSASPSKSPAIAMGRAGIELATLGLKVRLHWLDPGGRDGNVLHRGRTAVATSCSKMQLTETSLYAHPYAHLASAQATCHVGS